MSGWPIMYSLNGSLWSLHRDHTGVYRPTKGVWQPNADLDFLWRWNSSDQQIEYRWVVGLMPTQWLRHAASVTEAYKKIIMIELEE